MQITLDRSGRDGIGLGCSSRCSGLKNDEHLPFRFLFRSEAHKPKRRILPVEHPKQASSPPWANPHWRVFFCPLNRPDGRDGHTVAETYAESLRRPSLRLGYASQKQNCSPANRMKENEQPLALFAQGLWFSFFFSALSPNEKGGLGGLFLFWFCLCFTLSSL